MARKKIIGSKSSKRKPRTLRTRGRRTMQKTRGRKRLRMSALDSNPFIVSGSMVIDSPLELKRQRDMSSSSAAIIWIYAEWCGHCHSFLPTWRELVRNHSEDSELELIMMNETGLGEEYPEGYPEITGFPTIWIMSRGETTPTVYQQRRDLKSMERVISDMI